MGQIAVHEFVSLDGVFEDPAWTFDVGFDPAMGERIGQITDAANGILLGRTTYEMFAPAWSTRTAEDDPGAPFFNDTRKYVVATRSPAVDWGPATVLDGYDADAIGNLKQSTDGLLYVSGSGTLVRALLGDGLVDQLHLFVFPMLLARGSDCSTAPAILAGSRFASTPLTRTGSCTCITPRPDASARGRHG